MSNNYFLIFYTIMLYYQDQLSVERKLSEIAFQYENSRTGQGNLTTYN